MATSCHDFFLLGLLSIHLAVNIRLGKTKFCSFLFCSPLGLHFLGTFVPRKLGFASEKQNSATFYFVLLSACTNFVLNFGVWYQ